MTITPRNNAWRGLPDLERTLTLLGAIPALRRLRRVGCGSIGDPHMLRVIRNVDLP
jgi:hypothetical protein